MWATWWGLGQGQEVCVWGSVGVGAIFGGVVLGVGGLGLGGAGQAQRSPQGLWLQGQHWASCVWRVAVAAVEGRSIK